MFWIFHDAPFVDGRGKTDRDSVILPAFRGLFYLGNQLFRRKFRAGIELALLPPGNHEFHVGAANIDNENFFHEASLSAMVMGVSLTTGAFWDSASLRAWPRDRSRKWSWACVRGAPSSGLSRT